MAGFCHQKKPLGLNLVIYRQNNGMFLKSQKGNSVKRFDENQNKLLLWARLPCCCKTFCSGLDADPARLAGRPSKLKETFSDGGRFPSRKNQMSRKNLVHISKNFPR